MAQCSKPEHQWPLHHTITCSEWKDPDKSQNPTHQPSRWGCFTTQGNYQYPGTTKHKEKECWMQPAKHSPGRPISGKVVKLCSTITEGEKHTESYMSVMPKHTFHHHSPLPDFVCGREAGSTTSSFQGKARGFLTLPKGTYGAPMGHSLQLHIIWRRAVRSP